MVVLVAGYTAMVLGVRSHCRLRDLWHISEDKYTMEVVPSLPQVSVSTSLPKAASFSSLADSASVVTSATVNLYAGQRYIYNDHVQFLKLRVWPIF